ncbi:hypothetical protein [Acidithiobacillus albertensis]|uniref:hypothetical protein n=1 Tax=Acidithiobacillus albertensis TaxID=119978 RepID=UPI001C06AA6C|nr:hypothetical protein [Acidithiobacillus albertensis]MBU2743382.1 hypothetical protein [Acidithiobacillus albertensis]
MNLAKQPPVLILVNTELGQSLRKAVKTWNNPSIQTDRSHRTLELKRSTGIRGKNFGQIFVDQQMMDMAVDHFARLARDKQLIGHTPWILASKVILSQLNLFSLAVNSSQQPSKQKACNPTLYDTMVS